MHVLRIACESILGACFSLILTVYLVCLIVLLESINGTVDDILI